MQSELLKKNLIEIKKKLPSHVNLVAVSKTHPASAVEALYNMGQRKFGENRVQELLEKQEQLPQDIEWHLIGHLQTNKVKFITPFIALIESVDSEKLLLEIDRQAAIKHRKIKVLLQIKIAEEDTKSGMDAKLAEELLEKYQSGIFENIKIVGLMGMATFTDNADQVRNEFRYLKNLYEKWKDKYQFDTLSMGMSSDYEIAVNFGSTSVRVGSAIFGERE